MIFHVGPATYRVRITEEPLKDREGKRVCGLAVYQTGEILISTEVPPARRFEVLLHELRHCYSFHGILPRDVEAECDLFAAAADSAMQDLERQGGRKALEALTPAASRRERPKRKPRSLSSSEHEKLRYVPIDCAHRVDVPAQASGRRAQCGVCGSIVADGSVVNESHAFEPRHGGWVLRRALYCPHCHHIQRWVEGSNPGGVPNGDVAEGPTYLQGKAVELFLDQHPEAVGMFPS